MKYRLCTVSLESLSPYSQSGFFKSVKKEKETHEAFEERCWKEKMHSANGHVVIPAMAFKYCFDEACRRLQLKVPGGGKTQYTKYFEAGTAVQKDVVLNVAEEDVRKEEIWANSDGVRGSGKRVLRSFPVMDEWKGDLEMMVFDEKIPDEIVEKVVESGGIFVGIGRFRPQNQGYFGRFIPKEFTWAEV